MSDTKTDPPPTPEEIGKKLEEFIRSQFGSNVMFTSFKEPGKDGPAPAPEAAGRGGRGARRRTKAGSISVTSPPTSRPTSTAS